MKRIKYLLLLVIILIPAIQSCTMYQPESVALVTMKTTGTNDYYFVLDGGKTMYASERVSYATSITPVDGQRAIIYFTMLSTSISGYDYNVKLYNIGELLTKKIVTLDDPALDTLGQDKINLTSINISGGYINVEFAFYSEGNIMHSINMLDNQTVEHSKDSTFLEFRHKANGDTTGTKATGIACFKLGAYDPALSSKAIVVKVHTWDGDKEYKLSK
ncbi:MAG: NigD-like C-terminal domain-containing protein [Bacteroidales bacterium]